MKKSVLAGFITLILVACGGSGTNTPSNPVAITPPPAAPITSVSLTGLRSDYSILKTSSGYSVTDKTGVAQSYSQITQFVFSDMRINLGIGDKSQTISSANLQSLIELYIAYFNRVPDADGLSYWIDQVKAGQSIDQIGQSFYSAAIQYSLLTGYSATMTNTDFIKIIYKNVLGRDTVDQEGLDYWTKSLTSGVATRGTLINTILGSAHRFKGDQTYGWVADLLDNKVKLANLFTIQQGINYTTDEESISKTMALVAAVKPNNTANAVNLIGRVDWMFREVPSPTFKSAPIPVQRTSYLNFKNNGQGQTSLPEYTHAMAYGDFFQDGSISLMMSPVSANVNNPADFNKTGLVYFFKRVNNAWVDKTTEILTDTTGCVWPRKAVSADFNGDGKPDIFLACHGFDAAPFDGEKQVIFLSQADGKYKRTLLDIYCYCHGATAADFKGDGFADIVITDTSNNFRQPIYLRNNRDGTFTPSKSELPVSVSVFSYPGQTITYSRGIFNVEFVDVNGDGNPDLYFGGGDVDYAGRTESQALSAWTPKIFTNHNNTFNQESISIPIDQIRPGSLDILVEGDIIWTLKVDYANPTFKIQQYNMKQGRELDPVLVPNNGIFWIIRDAVKGVVTAG